MLSLLLALLNHNAFCYHSLSFFLYVASRIRGTVASVPFEQFHKFSADIITAAVFGKTADGKVKSELVFEANNLVRQITKLLKLSSNM